MTALGLDDQRQPAMGRADLETSLARLMANPLLPLSLGAKELFHSNFLAWVLETNPAVASRVLPPLRPDEDGVVHVRREARQLDLVLEGQNSVVVENKTFSLPEEAQLDRYNAVNIPALGLQQPVRLLLALTNPGWPDGEYNGWRWVSYGDVALGLEASLREHPFADDFSQQVATRWIDMVRDLEVLVRYVEPDDEGAPLLLPAADTEILRPTRLVDALAKARVRRVRHACEQRLQAVDVPYDLVGSNFMKGSPLLEAAVSQADGCLLGWQLQGNQWRRFVRVSEPLHGRDEAARQRRIDHVAEAHSSWFDFRLESELVRAQAARTATYKHYAPDFVYDYVKVADLTVGEVLSLAEVVLRAANQAACATPEAQIGMPE